MAAYGRSRNAHQALKSGIAHNASTSDHSVSFSHQARLVSGIKYHARHLSRSKTRVKNNQARMRIIKQTHGLRVKKKSIASMGI